MFYLVYPLNLRAFTSSLDYAYLLLSFGFAHLPFSYLLSFLFSDPSTALKAYSGLYLIGGFLVPLLLKQICLAAFGCWAYHLSELLFGLIPLNPLFNGFNALVRREHAKFFQSMKKREQRTGWGEDEENCESVF
jgi:hypothetical protein